jgi:maleate isomerase
MDVSFLGGPQPQRGVGIVAPFDFALDRELWRWVPDDVSLHLTRTPFVPVEVSLDQARLVSEHETLREGVQALCAVSPDVVAYACTSGSFVGGTVGEASMTAAMEEAGEAPSLTTSGALLTALQEIGARRIALVTPYTKSVTDSLENFLGEAGIAVTGRSYLGLTREIWRVPYRDVVDMAREAVVDAPDALFISCTNLPTYDVIPQLEAELRMPVLSANQVTVWEALRRIGKQAVGPYQALLDPVARRGPAAMTSSAPGQVVPPEPVRPLQAEPVRPVEAEAALAGAGAETGESLEGYDQPCPSSYPDERGGGGQPPG